MRDFDKIYAEYYSEVYKFALGLCRDPSLAEEITQEAFFRTLKSIDSFKGECRLSTWLCKIAKNTFYDYARKTNRLSELRPETLISGDSIEERIADKETAYAVHKILHNMKEPHKEVFWLRAFGELSFAGIGELFGKSESWARVTYYRAKLLIREELL